MSTIPRLRDLRSPASTQRLSLGCPHLDALLGGGIPVGCLTEVAGAFRVGKQSGTWKNFSILHIGIREKRSKTLNLNLKPKQARPPRARRSSASASSSTRSSPETEAGSTDARCGSAPKRGTHLCEGLHRWLQVPLHLLLILLILRLLALRQTTSTSKRASPPYKSS